MISVRGTYGREEICIQCVARKPDGINRMHNLAWLVG